MIRFIVNLVGFELGWAACILGGAHGMVWLGPVVVALIVGVNVALHPARKRELLLIAIVALGGTLIDTGLHAAGLITFDAGGSGTVLAFVPWIAALWVNFASVLSVSLHWLGRFPVAASIIGAISGPMTYYAGVKLGAIGFAPDQWASLGALAIEWAVVLPAALILARRIHQPGLGESTPEGVGA